MSAVDSEENIPTRVTRSLRKRLTSVDSEVSSRPGTPQTISSPSTMSRVVTRRRSIQSEMGTPVKKFNLDTSSAVNSPIRRSTRRRSVTAEEEPVPPSKSKNISTVDTIQEEAVESFKRITRSASKSPNTSEEKKSQLSKKAKASSKIIAEVEENGSSEKSPTTQKMTIKKAVVIVNDFTNISNSSRESATINEEAEAEKIEDKEIEDEKIEEEKIEAKKLADEKIENKKNDTVEVMEIDSTNNDSVEVIDTSKTDHSLQINTSKKQRSVTFDDSDVDGKDKPIYPKTPLVVKSKSYIDLDSSNESEKSIDFIASNSVKSASANDKNKNAADSDHDEMLLNAKTPYKSKLTLMSSSTPKEVPSNGEAKLPEKKEINKKENKCGEFTEFAKSWNQSVRKSVTEDDKIDELGVKELEADKEENDNVSMEKRNKKKHSKEEDDIKYIDSNEEDEDEEDDRNSFIDDEAEVVEGEEDSMDSEEREYIEQHEVPVRGESLGSDDSDESMEVDEYDENDSFIASEEDLHSGVLLVDTDEDDLSMDATKKASKKKFKRIQEVDDSSADDKSDEEKDKIEFSEKSGTIEIQYSEEKVKERRQSLKKSIKEILTDKKECKEGSQLNTSFVINHNEEKSNSDAELESLKSKKTLNEDEDNVNEDKLADKDINVPDESEEILSTSKSARKSLNKSKTRLSTISKLAETDVGHISFSETKKRNSLVDKIIVNEVKLQEESEENINTSKMARKSLNQSKTRHSITENCAEGDAELAESEDDVNISKKDRKSLNQLKKRHSITEKCAEGDVESEDNAESEDDVNISKKARTSLNQSKTRHSITAKYAEDNAELAESEDDVNISKKTRKSLNQSKTQHSITSKFPEDDAKHTEADAKHTEAEDAINTNKKDRKSLNKSTTRHSVTSKSADGEYDDDVNEEQLQTEAEEANTNKLVKKSLNQSRRSTISKIEEDEIKSQLKHSTSVNKNHSIVSIRNDLSVHSTSDSESDVDDQLPHETIQSKEKNEYSLVELNTSKVSNGHNRSVSKSIIAVEHSSSDMESDDAEKKIVHANNESSMHVDNESIHETYNPDVEKDKSMHVDNESLHDSSIADGETSSDGKRLDNSISSKKNINNSTSLSSENEEDDEPVKPHTMKNLNPKGLSVSFCGVERTKKSKSAKSRSSALHTSYTTGMYISTNKDSSDSIELDDADDDNDNDFNNKSIINVPTNGVSSSNNSNNDNSSDGEFSEEEDLKKLSDVQRVTEYKPRNSLSKIMVKEGTFKKRRSLVGNEILSSSFAEDITLKKKKSLLSKQKSRLSKSLVVSSNPDKELSKVEDNVQINKGDKKLKDHDNIQYILNRCDAILEAANKAKREAKLQAKMGINKPKRFKKKSNEIFPEANEEKEVVKPETKEKYNREISKALLVSNKILSSGHIEKQKKKMTKPKESGSSGEDNNKSLKRLPAEFLEAFDGPKEKKKKTGKDYYKEAASTSAEHTAEDGNVEKKKKRKYKSELESDSNENKESTHFIKNPSGLFVEETLVSKKSKKSKKTKQIELPTGIVTEEPVTPAKKKKQNGFTETTATPQAIGFKVRSILSAGQKEIPTLTVDKSGKKKKHREIREPLSVLPKPKWTSSGDFLEENVNNEIILEETQATKFALSSLGSKKSKKPTGLLNQKALDFKKKALHSDRVARETPKEMLARKMRKNIHNKF